MIKYSFMKFIKCSNNHIWSFFGIEELYLDLYVELCIFYKSGSGSVVAEKVSCVSITVILIQEKNCIPNLLLKVMEGQKI